MPYADAIQIALTSGLLLATGASAWAAVQQRAIGKRLATLEERREERRVEIVRVAPRPSPMLRGTEFDSDMDWVEVVVANPTGNQCVIAGVQDRQWVSQSGWFGGGSGYGSVWVEAREGEEGVDGLTTRSHLVVMPGHVERLYIPVNVSRQTMRTGLMVYLTGPNLEEALDWAYLTNPLVFQAEQEGSPVPDFPDPLRGEFQMDTWYRMFPDERRRLRHEGQPIPPDNELRDWNPSTVAEFVSE